MSLNDTGFEYQGNVSSNWAKGEISRRDAIIAVLTAELSTLRAENDRLRERCEAATNFQFGDITFQRYIRWPGEGGLNPYWRAYRPDYSNRPHGCFYINGEFASFDEAYQAAIAAGWLPDSKNKGGE